MTSSEKFEFESIQDPQTIRDFLQALTQGFANNRILLKSEDEALELIPTQVLHFWIKAKRKGSENKLTIKIAWKDGDKNSEQVKSLHLES